MSDPRFRQWESVEEPLERRASEPSLTPPVQRAEPDPSHVMRERLERPEVARQTEVRIMPAQHLTQPPMLIADRFVTPTLRFLVQRRELPR